MKNDKSAEKSSTKKTGTPTDAIANKKGRGATTSSDSTPNATAKAKPKSGRGLANEGTVVSYEEER